MSNTIVRFCLISGAASSGKTCFSKNIVDRITTIKSTIKSIGIEIFLLSTDLFYKNLTSYETLKLVVGDYNYDHPDAINQKELLECIEKFANPNEISVSVPKYDHASCCQTGTHEIIFDQHATYRIVIIKGIFAMYYPRLRELSSLSIFLDAPSDVCLATRIRKKINQGYDSIKVIDYYLKFIKPGFAEFIAPTEKYANIIIMNDNLNEHENKNNKNNASVDAVATFLLKEMTKIDKDV